MKSNPDYKTVYNKTAFNIIYEPAQHIQYSNYNVDNQLTAVWLPASVRFVSSSESPDQIRVLEAPPWEWLGRESDQSTHSDAKWGYISSFSYGFVASTGTTSHSIYYYYY